PRGPLALLAWAPFAVPGAVLAAGLIRLYDSPVLDRVYGSAGILVIAGAARLFPIAFHALAAHLRAVPRDLWEAAALARLPAARWLRRVYLPLAAPGLGLAG